ncbi:MAG: peptide-methionine (S)-S-oxide reductase MsrA [Candidatus Sericytochromatia bacterium]|nr:peptide-methionine (S)-S-oxide reductase MsrA [Candidatus Sericytochromatia bacterium]
MTKKRFKKSLNITGISLIFIIILTFNVFAQSKKEIATLSGGCFWSMETMFQRLKGVSSVQSGFAGGFVKNPSYDEVCTGKTGHAETIQVTFDPDKISYQKILQVFWKVHNPTTLNRQGNDDGTQYRSAIFYHNKKQREIAEKSKIAEAKSGHWGTDPIVTEINVYTNFYKAEAYHKDYYNKHTEQPYCESVITPKVEKFTKEFRNLLKE